MQTEVHFKATKGTAPTVELRNITKQFADGPTIIDDVTVSAAPGELVSLVGPSGCGKSTLLRMLAGLSQPSGGTVQINGQPRSSTDTDTAFIFQDATLLPWLTVRGNIEVPLRLRGETRKNRTALANQLANWVGLGDRLNYYPRQLSGGMQMRVSLARALSLSPSILLLDEPFGALDAITRNRLNEDLLQLRERQMWTAFFVTHSISEAVFLSSRIIVLSTRPARVATEITVPFPFPRTADLRHSLEFQKLVATANEALYHHSHQELQ
ncbi:MAG: ABC transporter ATP-binding protein [Verrucomicrobia bacterium]|nr:ABC transporter ATP-binding protein [Verrucomicrobiota bacterium]